MTTWRHRLKTLIAETPGLSMKALSLKAGLGESAVRDILNRGASPTLESFVAICKALGVSPSDLLQGDDTSNLSIPIVGVVSSGETFTAVDEAQLDPVAINVASPEAIAIEIRGSSMAPAYRDGDLLICHRQSGMHVDNLIGLDCAVRTRGGAQYVKILRKGSRPRLYTLRSYNPASDDIEDVAIEWAAPVVWIKRHGR